MNPIQPKSGVAPLGADAARGKTPAKTGKASASEVAQEQVTLSATAQALLQAQGERGQPSRIEALRTAIQNGSYAILPGKIGQGLVQEQQQLLANRSNRSRS